MPYANIEEAFTTYSDSYSSNGRSIMYGGADESSLDSIRQPYNINNTDPADDFPNIASNYIPDNYNFKYTGNKQWEVLNDDIRGLNSPSNTSFNQSPDQPLAVRPAQIRTDNIQPVSANRPLIDRLWDRPTGAEVDDIKRAQNRENLDQGAPDVQLLSAPSPNSDRPILSTAFSDRISNDCSDQNCMTLLNHILACPGCTDKLKTLLGVSDNRLFGFQLPKINLSKFMFWIVLLIILVAVYELLNTLFRRITNRII